MAAHRILVGCAWISFLLLCAPAQAEDFVCVCKAPNCGNGGTPGVEGKLYRDVPSLSAERIFGPSRTGSDKTGWVCQSQTAYDQVQASRDAQARNAQEVYTCTCKRDSCEGIAVIPGSRNEKHERVARGLVAANYLPSRTDGSGTGWECQNSRGEEYEPPPAAGPPPSPPPTRAAAQGAADSNQRYSCRCTLPTCGGKDGITEGERGQVHSGVSGARLGTKYGPQRSGKDASGWTCQSEGPPPKYTCLCTRDSCGGKNGVLEGERGQKHTAVSAVRLPASYAPERTGAEATGWKCEIEHPEGAPAAPAGSVPGIVIATVAPDPGYRCRCEGWGGCGFGGAPNAKRGEVRDGVALSQIDTLYHSDKPGGWVCTRAPGTGGDPGYVCRCDGWGGCGAGGTPNAKRGEVHEGVPEQHLSTLYHSDQPGGWVCTRK